MDTYEHVKKQELPIIYNGVKLEDMTREELIECVKYLKHELTLINKALATIIGY